MKLILSTLFFGLIATHANASTISTLQELENRYVQEIVNCPFSSQFKGNKHADKRTVASLVKKKDSKKAVDHKVTK
ncbi:MAG: hypothetical protein HAW60_00960 [Bdellovibrionales bacterium]|nr:hypothetical protein [Bdellovibrionales bacterium]